MAAEIDELESRLYEKVKASAPDSLHQELLRFKQAYQFKIDITDLTDTKFW